MQKGSIRAQMDTFSTKNGLCSQNLPFLVLKMIYRGQKLNLPGSPFSWVATSYSTVPLIDQNVVIVRGPLVPVPPFAAIRLSSFRQSSKSLPCLPRRKIFSSVVHPPVPSSQKTLNEHTSSARYTCPRRLPSSRDVDSVVSGPLDANLRHLSQVPNRWVV